MSRRDEMREYLKEIALYLNGPEILLPLCAHGVLILQEGEFLLSETVERTEKAERLLTLLEQRTDGRRVFIQCLSDETTHLGHQYLAALLNGRALKGSGPGPWWDANVVTASLAIKRRLSEKATNVRDININALTPFLLREGLLTDSENEMLLTKGRTRCSKILDLLRLLDTKGPFAHYLFALCLKDERTHPTHSELYKLLTTGLSSVSKESIGTFKPSGAGGSVPMVMSKLQVEDGLRTPDYFKMMRRIRRLHLSGNWIEADTFVEECIESLSPSDIDIHIAILLENCTGWITRRRTDIVLNSIKKAREMCTQIETNNSSTLEGRCEWALAKMHRYSGKIDEAQEHVRNAMEIQFNTEGGEDKALTLYCHGSIQLTLLASKYDLKTAKRARGSLEAAITNASMDNYGLDLSHPKIRLAQACLGSSPFQPGRITDRESIQAAKSSLAAINFEALAQRSKCIFLFTESDLYRNAGDHEKALECAKMALHIAKLNGFKTEVLSVQHRLRLLHQSRLLSLAQSPATHCVVGMFVILISLTLFFCFYSLRI